MAVIETVHAPMSTLWCEIRGISRECIRVETEGQRRDKGLNKRIDCLFTEKLNSSNAEEEPRESDPLTYQALIDRQYSLRALLSDLWRPSGPMPQCLWLERTVILDASNDRRIKSQ